MSIPFSGVNFLKNIRGCDKIHHFVAPSNAFFLIYAKCLLLEAFDLFVYSHYGGGWLRKVAFVGLRHNPCRQLQEGLS